MSSERPDAASAPLLEPEGIKAHVIDEDLVVFELPLPGPNVPDVLTPAEAEVACAVYEGLSNRQIAERRGVSARTVANQLDAVFRKLDVSSRVELILCLRDASRP